MNILYYTEPELHAGSKGGGVSMVAFNLTRVLDSRVNLTCFPSNNVPSRSYPFKLLKIYSRFVGKDFKIIHFNFNPVINNGSYLMLRLAKKMGSSTLFKHSRYYSGRILVGSPS